LLIEKKLLELASQQDVVELTNKIELVKQGKRDLYF